MYKMSKYPTGSSYKMSKSPLSSKSVHHSSGNVQVSSKSTSKPQTLRLYENLRSLILKANRPSPPPPPSPPRSTQTGLHAYSGFNYQFHLVVHCGGGGGPFALSINIPKPLPTKNMGDQGALYVCLHGDGQ